MKTRRATSKLKILYWCRKMQSISPSSPTVRKESQKGGRMWSAGNKILNSHLQSSSIEWNRTASEDGSADGTSIIYRSRQRIKLLQRFQSADNNQQPCSSDDQQLRRIQMHQHLNQRAKTASSTRTHTGLPWNLATITKTISSLTKTVLGILNLMS